MDSRANLLVFYDFVRLKIGLLFPAALDAHSKTLNVLYAGRGDQLLILLGFHAFRNNSQ